MAEFWLKCTECKSEIAYGAKYYQCSVSTCNRSKLRLVFCSVICWDSHLADARHRDAWAEEARAPTREAWQRELAAQGEPAKPAGGVAPARPAPAAPAPVAPQVRPAAAPISPPVRSGPPPTADSSQPVRSGPPPTADSSQPVRSGPPSPPSSASPSPSPAPVRRVVGDASPVTAAAVEGVKLAEVTEREILIVVSKMKKYIKDRSGMNCSDSVADMLSDHVRLLCDEAIRAAARDERKTVLDRDVSRVRR